MHMRVHVLLCLSSFLPSLVTYLMRVWFHYIACFACGGTYVRVRAYRLVAWRPGAHCPACGVSWCGVWCVLLCVVCFGLRPLLPCCVRTASLGGVHFLCVQRARVGMLSWLHLLVIFAGSVFIALVGAFVALIGSFSSLA